MQPHILRRLFSTTPTHYAHRALVYNGKGEPSAVLRAVTFPALAPPPPKGLNIRILAAPVNPADVNVIQGVYPEKPKPAVPEIHSASGAKEGDRVYVGGNEGIAEVVSVGSAVQGVNQGDWVLLTKSQSGTWRSSLTVNAEDTIRVPKHAKVSPAHAATLTANPPTAWNMLHDFAKLSPGDYVLQNGANSAVGQNVIQIAKHLGLKTINFVRSRDDIDTLRAQLHGLGANHVYTYDALEDPSTISHLKSLTSERPIRLFLNCVAGPATTAMAKLVGHDGHLVTYGAMARQPVSLPASAFIFKNLTSHGFWQTRWYERHSRQEREELVKRLMGLIADGKLKAPDANVVTLVGTKSDSEVTKEVQALMDRMAKGYSKKVIFVMEDPVDGK